MTASSPLERLPVELFDIVAASLDLHAYQALRLASRRLHALTLNPFAKRYFTELTSTLGSPSLDRLLNVSNSYFRESVVLLDIRLLTHRDYKTLVNIQKVGIYPPPKRFRVVHGVKHISGESTLYDDVLGRNYPQCITERLTRALQGFPNCTRIRFRAHRREPIGWESKHMPDGDKVFRARCFQAVFDAILTSGIQLHEFSMAKLKHSSAVVRCADVAYPMLPSSTTLPQLQHCFLHLTSLTISAVTADLREAPPVRWAEELGRFIACAPSLRSLTLSLDRSSVIRWESMAIIRSLALSCRLSSLETLHLTNCAVFEAHLLQFLAAHAGSLVRIIMSRILVHEVDWDSEKLFTALQDIDGLRRFRLAHLLQPNGQDRALRCNGEKRTKFVLDADEAARPMKELLEELVIAAREAQRHDGGDLV